VYQLGYPLINANPDRAWRLMLWAGVIPAMIIFILMTRVSESPMWLEQQRQRSGRPARLSIARMFDKDLLWVTLHTSLLMGAFVWMYQSTTIWYPTLLNNLKQQPLQFLLLLNAGGMIGSIAFGWLSEKWGGRRGSASVGMVAGILSTPLYLFATSSSMLMLGAWLIGFCASGAWGIVPGYLSERFPTEVRGVGTGFSYHVGVGIGAFAPYLIGVLQDGGTQLQTAMFWCIIGGGIGVVTLLWLGPETRGTSLERD
jgi:MFS transporter, SHS family, lactate transporter